MAQESSKFHWTKIDIFGLNLINLSSMCVGAILVFIYVPMS